MGSLGKIGMLVGLIGVTAAPAVATELAPLTQEAKTGHYRLDLQIGPTEKMFTMAEVAANHPTEGEVMVGGSMSTGMPMPMMSMAPGETRHLEVHVFSLDSGKVVTDATVVIAVTDTGSKKTEKFTVAKMYAIKEGPSDTHYGNNVSWPAGSYRVSVTVNGEKAEFTVAVPAS